MDPDNDLYLAVWQPDVITLFIFALIFGGAGAVVRQVINGSTIFKNKNVLQVWAVGFAVAIVFGGLVSFLIDTYFNNLGMFIRGVPLVNAAIFLVAGIMSPECIKLLVKLFELLGKRIEKKVSGQTEDDQENQEKPK